MSAKSLFSSACFSSSPPPSYSSYLPSLAGALPSTSTASTAAATATTAARHSTTDRTTATTATTTATKTIQMHFRRPASIRPGSSSGYNRSSFLSTSSSQRKRRLRLLDRMKQLLHFRGRGDASSAAPAAGRHTLLSRKPSTLDFRCIGPSPVGIIAGGELSGGGGGGTIEVCLPEQAAAAAGSGGRWYGGV